jgi:hypothetical protein
MAKEGVRSPVTMAVTTVTPSGAQRTPAPGDRIATSRAPSTGTVNEAHRPEERGTLRLTDWLGGSQASIRASYFPQTAPSRWVGWSAIPAGTTCAAPDVIGREPAHPPASTWIAWSANFCVRHFTLSSTDRLVEGDHLAAGAVDRGRAVPQCPGRTDSHAAQAISIRGREEDV